MGSEYIPLLILVALAAIICTAMVTLSWVLGPKASSPYKSAPYECGVEPIGSTRERFPIKFYLVGMLFILFDIEVVFLWSWLSVYGTAATEYKVFTFLVLIVYMILWFFGDAYVLRVNAIDWDESTSLAHLGPGDQDDFEYDALSTPEIRELQPTGAGQ
ncbi:MAG: NADH-quinone oxidoreductase subunit A [Fimbriimonadaceae bacterium]|jgi:NADH-quinone oxidoreductase subunit A